MYFPCDTSEMISPYWTLNKKWAFSFLETAVARNDTELQALSISYQRWETEILRVPSESTHLFLNRGANFSGQGLNTRHMICYFSEGLARRVCTNISGEGLFHRNDYSVDEQVLLPSSAISPDVGFSWDLIFSFPREGLRHSMGCLLQAVSRK